MRLNLRRLIAFFFISSIVCAIAVLVYANMRPQRELVNIWHGPAPDVSCQLLAHGIIYLIVYPGNKYVIRGGDIGCRGTYRLEQQGNQRFVELEYEDHHFRYQYEIEGNTLTLIRADGNGYVYEWRERFICESSMC